MSTRSRFELGNASQYRCANAAKFQRHALIYYISPRNSAFTSLHTSIIVINHRPISLFCIKSFGDFIIARWALRRLDATARQVSIIIGDHLSELNAALEPQSDTYCIKHGEGSVPAMFDINKLGVRRGIYSALRVRHLVAGLNLPEKSVLIFDKVGLREHFVALYYNRRGLPNAENIYLAYQEFFGLESALISSPTSTVQAVAPKSVGIFPGSRVLSKVLPESVIKNLVNTCVTQGMNPTVFILDGEGTNFSLPQDCVTVLPRRFDAMVSAVRSMDTIISADSMPAHLAEYFGKSIFVISPKPNKYWLPLSCIVNSHWGLFDEIFKASGMLQRFLYPCNGSSL